MQYIVVFCYFVLALTVKAAAASMKFVNRELSNQDSICRTTPGFASSGHYTTAKVCNSFPFNMLEIKTLEGQ